MRTKDFYFFATNDNIYFFYRSIDRNSLSNGEWRKNVKESIVNINKNNTFKKFIKFLNLNKMIKIDDIVFYLSTKNNYKFFIIKNRKENIELSEDEQLLQDVSYKNKRYILIKSKESGNYEYS